jgi:hypothetical protein
LSINRRRYTTKIGTKINKNRKHKTMIKKLIKTKNGVEHLLSQYKALDSSPGTTKKKRGGS